MSVGIPKLTVGTLNISWEANNAVYIRGPGEFRVLGPRQTATGTGLGSAFERARRLWDADFLKRYKRGPFFGPAYEESIRLIKTANPPLDVVLLQEFQIYTTKSGNGRGGLVSTLDVLVDQNHLNDFTVAAVKQSGGGRITTYGSVILVRTSLIYRGTLPTDRSDDVDWSSSIAFDNAYRLVAVADVKLYRARRTGTYRIVSSHSGHRVDWTDVNRVKRYIFRLEFPGVGGGPAPQSFIWGGDFNSELSVGADGDTTPTPAKWLGRPIRKVSRGSMPKDTTEFGKRVDWIMGTSTTGGNPLEIKIAESGSDHRLVQITTQGRLWDWTENRGRLAPDTDLSVQLL